MKPTITLCLLLTSCSDVTLQDYVEPPQEEESSGGIPYSTHNYCAPQEAVMRSEGDSLPGCVSAQTFISEERGPLSIILYTGDCNLDGHQHLVDIHGDIRDYAVLDRTDCEPEDDSPDNYIELFPQVSEPGQYNFDIYLLNQGELGTIAWQGYEPLLGQINCPTKDNCFGMITR